MDDGKWKDGKEKQNLLLLMPPGMTVRSGSIMRRRSSVRKKSTTVSFAMDLPVDRRGSFRASVKRRMSTSRRNMAASRTLESNLPSKATKENAKSTWRSRAFGEKNYLALKRLAVILQDKRDDTRNRKKIYFQAWSKKLKQRRQLEVAMAIEGGDGGSGTGNFLVKGGSGNELRVVLKSKEKKKWIQLVLNGIFLVTGISLLAAVLIVIIYTSFVENESRKYGFSTKRNQHLGPSILDESSVRTATKKKWPTTMPGNDAIQATSDPFVDDKSKLVTGIKFPCLGVPLTLGNSPIVISFLCSSSSSSSTKRSNLMPPRRTRFS